MLSDAVTKMLCCVSVKEDTLLDMVSSMNDNTGLIHQMPFVCDRDGFAGVLEKVGTMTTGGISSCCNSSHM